MILIENVKAAAVEDEFERPAGRRLVQEIDRLEAAAPMRRGARTLDGGQHVRQLALLAFERWTRRPAPLEVMRAAMD